MNRNNSSRSNGIRRFWDRYLAFIARKGVIKPSAARWYVIRVEQYIKAFPDKRLATHATVARELPAEQTFMQYLAVHRNGAQSTQRQALNALGFFSDHVIEKP